jgi:hypothetical protein
VFLYAFLLFLLGGCASAPRHYSEADAGTESASLSIALDSTDALSSANGSGVTLMQDSGALSNETQLSAVSSKVASPDGGATSNQIPRNPTESDGGAPTATDDAADTGGHLEEGEPCQEHSQCLLGLACGYVGDPQWRQTGCLRLGRVESDCGGALGRLVFGQEVAPLPDGFGLCVGDIR